VLWHFPVEPWQTSLDPHRLLSGLHEPPLHWLHPLHPPLVSSFAQVPPRQVLHAPQSWQHSFMPTQRLPPQLFPVWTHVPPLQELHGGQPAWPFVQQVELETQLDPQTFESARFPHRPFWHSRHVPEHPGPEAPLGLFVQRKF
jgi:hypothetical protein